MITGRTYFSLAMTTVHIFRQPKAMACQKTFILSQMSTRSLSSFVHDAYHRIQSTIVSSLPQEQHMMYNEEKAKEWLSSFRGGQVHLELDEKSGLSTITFDHTSRKNAFTGCQFICASN